MPTPDLPSVVLHASGNSHHSHQVIAGYIALARNRELDLRITWSRRDPALPSNTWLLAEVDGLRIGYDLDDGDVLDPDVVDAFADGVDVLFRRSRPITPSDTYRTGAEHRALGLNYHATSRHPYFWNAAFRSNVGPRRFGALAVAEWSRSARLRVGDPQSDNGKILFQTRLWEPETRTTGLTTKERWRADDRNAINRERIALLRALKAEFGDRFQGGLSPTDHALAVAPELVLPASRSNPATFLRASRAARVCITTRGLWNSNGWKLAEYLAQGCAVVCERPMHEAPGLREGHQYLGFSSVDEALDAVHRLDADTVGRSRLRTEARRYFDEYVEPSALVRRSLRVAVSGHDDGPAVGTEVVV